MDSFNSLKNGSKFNFSLTKKEVERAVDVMKRSHTHLEIISDVSVASHHTCTLFVN